MFSKFQYFHYYFSRSVSTLLYKVTVTTDQDVSLYNQKYIIAINHSSYFDPLLFAGSIPTKNIASIKPIYGLTGQKFYQRPWLRPLLLISGGIELKSKGLSIEDFFGQAIEKAASGASIIIFPEGKIIKQVSEPKAQSGVIYLAKATGLPILPVQISGLSDKSKLLRRRKVNVHYYKPVTVPDSLKGLRQHKESAQSLIELIYSRGNS